jgi:hypothetical protein
MNKKSNQQHMFACGVLCSGCGAYGAQQQSRAYQKRVRDAWERIYQLHETVGRTAGFRLKWFTEISDARKWLHLKQRGKNSTTEQ